MPPQTAQRRAQAGDPLAGVQQQADRSDATGTLQALQRRADGGLQREVDTSRSPSVGRGDPDYEYPLPKTDGVPAWAAERFGAPEYDADGVLHNDGTDGVPAWAANHYADVNQGPEGVDDRRITENDAYDDRGDLDVDRSVGVPHWAKQDYEATSKTELIASIKDGKIGSVYFLDGRIRTTHGHGPELDIDDPRQTSVRYNLDMNVARRIFANANPGLFTRLKKTTPWRLKKRVREERAYKLYDKAFKRWLSRALLNTPNDALPMWVVPVTRPDEAFDLTGAPPANLTLFEVFKKVSNGRVMGWHPSRGIAAKFETNKQVVSVLKAALAHIEGVDNVNQRNARFYDFILHRIPDLAAKIRRPDEI